MAPPKEGTEPLQPNAVPPGTLRDEEFPGEAYLAVLTWLFGWWAITRLFFLEVSPYVFACALAVHVRFRPPLGQVPPLADPVLIFIWPWSGPVAAACAGMAVYSFVTRSCWWWWLGAALAACAAVYRRRHGAAKVKAAFDELGRPRALFGPPPARPFITKLHGYLFTLFSVVEGRSKSERIRISRTKPDGCGVKVDVWTQDGVEQKNLPVLLFAHGGGWKGGGARMNPHSAMLQLLASRGWLVISVDYGMTKWPMQLEDCMAALRWVARGGAASLGADTSRIVLSGASAGGHIASLMMIQAHEERIPLAASLLFYPALDPGDLSDVTSKFPIACKPLGVHAGQSMLHWFFENFILGREKGMWPSATVLHDLQPDAGVTRSWPPTLVIHGLRDSVVPVEHSRNFLAMLASSEGRPMRTCDALVEVPGGRHTFDIVHCDEAAEAFQGAASWLDVRVCSA